MIYATISKTIKHLRVVNGISQKQLADKIGVTSAAVSNWEKRANKIDLDTLIRVAEFFGVPVSYIIGECPQLTAEEQRIIETFRANDTFRVACIALLGVDNKL